MGEEVKELKEKIGEILRWYLHCKETMPPWEFARARIYEERDIKLAKLGMKEVVLEDEVCFDEDTCVYYVGSVERPPKVYDVYALIRGYTLLSLTLEEHILIDEHTPVAEMVEDDFDWTRVRPHMMKKVEKVIEEIAAAEWENRYDKLKEIAKKLKESPEPEFKQLYEELKEVAELYEIELE